MTLTPITTAPKHGFRMDAATVLQKLDAYCGEQGAGAVVPSQNELVTQWGASERAARWALAELQRQGKIVRRQGARSFVAGLHLKGQVGNSADLNGQMTSSTPFVDITNRTIVVIETPDGSFFDRGVELLFKKTQNLGLSFVFRPYAPNVSEPMPNEKPLGYLMMGIDVLPLAIMLRDAGHRVVILGTPPHGMSLQVPHVQGNQELGGYLAARHLIDLGHRHLAFCGSPAHRFSQRWAGQERAIREARQHGVSVELSLLPIPEDRWKNKTGEVEHYFSQTDAPTGILAWNDREAVFLLSMLSYIGIRVPQRVSVVGYDNLPEGEQLHPSLSTVDGHVETQLQAALEILTSPSPTPSDYTSVVPPRLIVRDSSAKL